MEDLKSTSIVVTGATSGIGFQAALDFAQSGAFVIGVGRNPARCEEAKIKILLSVPGARIHFLVADLASQKQIHSLAQAVTPVLADAGFQSLDVLVNNAGVYMGSKEFTEDGIETTFAVNHLAVFLLTTLLLPLLEKSPGSRVITVSSDSHYHTNFNPEKASNPSFFFGLWAYKVSKLSNILFSAEFNRLRHGKAPRAFAVDPGLVNTEIGAKDTGGLAQFVWNSRKKQGVSPKAPSKTILFLAADPSVMTSEEVYWHDSQPKTPSRTSKNLALARRLWLESCRLCSLPVPVEGGLHVSR